MNRRPGGDRTTPILREMKNYWMMNRLLFKAYARILLPFLLLWFPTHSVQAGSTPFFSTLSMRDGLPSNLVSSITQDPFNFIWVGTGSGLCRYDGYQFKTFKKSESVHSLPSNEILSLLIDDSVLWVGTKYGLCRISTVTFDIEREPYGQGGPIRALYKDHQGNIWIGTEAGLIRYSRRLGTVRTYTTENSNLSHNTVRTIFEDSKEELWVGTYDKLNLLRPGADTFETIDLKGNYKPSLKNNLVLDIKPYTGSSDSLLWIGTETGLCLFNRDSHRFKHFSDRDVPFSNEVIKCIYIYKNNMMWLGTDFGLNAFNPVTGENAAYFYNPELAYSIANNVISQIFEDRGGVVWFVTSNGLSCLNKYGNFYQYHEISHQVENQTIGNQVKSFLITHEGIFWLATQHGAIRIDPKTGKKTVFDTDSRSNARILVNNVFALEEDSLHRIWIGTAAGINVWDEPHKKMYAITSNASNGLTSNYIAKFTIATDKSFWVSAWEGGIYELSGDFAKPGSIKFNLVYDISSENHVSGENAIWIIEYDELYRIDLVTHKKTHIKAFSQTSNKRSISCLYYSNRSGLLAGTQNGLVQYDPRADRASFYPIVTGNDVTLNCIMEDREGNVWGAANNSLHKFYLQDHHVEVYPLDKNIPLKSFYSGCSAHTPNGEIVFGGDNGYIIFSPENVMPNLYKPSVRITGLEINHKTVVPEQKVDGEVPLQRDISFTQDLTLKYAHSSIAFEFSSLHFWQPEMNVYAYKLEGLDKDWNYVSGLKNFAVYSNLSPQDYTLVVRGTNNYGIWSDQAARLNITIEPPLFLSKWFIVLYIVIALFLIYYGLRIYSGRVKLKNELNIIRLEKEHAEEIERTKEQFFANISHELRTPISLILPPIREILNRGGLDAKDKSLVHLAERNSRRLLRLVNQILDFNKLQDDVLQVKVTPLNLVDFCRDVCSLFEDKAHRNDIRFEIMAGVRECKVLADAEKIETVLFNLLSNAFKFTPRGGHIELTVNRVENVQGFPSGAAQICVRDSGIGITPEEKSRVFDRFYQSEEGKKADVGSGIGLTLAAEYVRLHHGSIGVESTIGEGTCFVVMLPLGKDHVPVDFMNDNLEINLLASRSAYAHQEGSKPYHLDLESDKPLMLVIEDNPEMIDFIRLSLKEKYNFITAENGEEGLIKAGDFLPEVIISDVMMPGMDGIALCRKIKENPKTTHIAIILITAGDLTSQKVQGIRSGADVYITKPFEIELLDASIENLRRRKKELQDYFRNELLFQPPPTSPKENMDDKFIKRVLDVIEANISDAEFSVERLSEEIGMSSTHLYRKLKSLTHLSANEVIKKYRIKKASLLLRNKEGNVSEIMYDVGFSNLSYFSKCFRAEFGVTPREYQQSPEGMVSKPAGAINLRSML